MLAFVASPYDSVDQLVKWERSGQLWGNVWATTEETLIGAGLALGIGIPMDQLPVVTELGMKPADTVERACLADPLPGCLEMAVRVL